MPCNTMLSSKNWGRGRRGFFGFQGGCCLETDWASVCLWEVVQCSSPPPSFVKQPLYCSQIFLVFALPFLSLVPPAVVVVKWGTSKWLCGCLAAGRGQPTASILFYSDVFFKMLFLLSFNELDLSLFSKSTFFFLGLPELLPSFDNPLL